MDTKTQKFQLTNSPALPASCVACGRSQSNSNQQFVDFNASLDWYGAILFCVDCIKEAYLAVAEPPVADNSVQEELELERIKNVELTSRLSSITTALSHVLSLDTLDVVLDKIQESRNSVAEAPVRPGTAPRLGPIK